MYEIQYKHLGREEADAKAIEDIKDWMGRDEKGAERFLILVEVANEILQGKSPFGSLNMTMGFVGIQGFPFHAFARKYCLEPYREWMMDDSDPVMVDEKGYTIVTSEVD